MAVIDLVSSGKLRSIVQILADIISYIKTFSGATTEANGTTGFVPQPLIADKDKFLKGDGTWATLTLPSVFTGCTESRAGSSGLVPQPPLGKNFHYLKGTGDWMPVVDIGYPDTLLAATALSSGYIIVGNANGYSHFGAGVSFDVSYPILVNMGTNVAAGNTFSTAWRTMNNKRLASTGFGSLTLVKDKMCYAKGVLVGSTFTVDSITPITQDVPNVEDGKVYIPLGIANSTSTISFISSRDIYEYRDGSFGPYKGVDGVDVSTLVTKAGTETITGVKTFDKNTFNTPYTLTGNSIDVSLSNVFSKTVTGDITLTFTGVPEGKTALFTLLLTNGGAYDVTFPNNIIWASSSGKPALKTSGLDILTFFTSDGGITWYDCGDSTNVYVGPTSNTNAISGLVPPARYAQKDYFLKGDGTWAFVTENGMFTDFVGATANTNGRQGMVPAPYIAERNSYLRGDGTWGAINQYTGATSNTNGVIGLVPPALIADKDKFLKGDGTWTEVNISNMMTTDTTQTITGTKTFGNVYNTEMIIDASSGEIDIDGTASVYTFTVSTHTDITFSIPITTGKSKVFTLIINNNPENNYAVYWPMNVFWSSGTPPTLNTKDVITFLGIYNTTANRVEYYGTPSVVDASTETALLGGQN